MQLPDFSQIRDHIRYFALRLSFKRDIDNSFGKYLDYQTRRNLWTLTHFSLVCGGLHSIDFDEAETLVIREILEYYIPGEYSGHYYYDYASRKLQKEYRRLHDSICFLLEDVNLPEESSN